MTCRKEIYYDVSVAAQDFDYQIGASAFSACLILISSRISLERMMLTGIRVNEMSTATTRK
jgi:hypothetical protein